MLRFPRKISEGYSAKLWVSQLSCWKDACHNHTMWTWHENAPKNTKNKKCLALHLQELSLDNFISSIYDVQIATVYSILVKYYMYLKFRQEDSTTSTIAFAASLSPRCDLKRALQEWQQFLLTSYSLTDSGQPRHNRQFWKSWLSSHSLQYLSNPWIADTHIMDAFAAPIIHKQYGPVDLISCLVCYRCAQMAFTRNVKAVLRQN